LPEVGEAQWAAIEAVIPKHLAEAAARDLVNGSMTDDGEMSPMMDSAPVDLSDDEEAPKKTRKKKTE
jgi:hypothetical protein